MTTQPGNEPTWYHRTVDAEPAAFAGGADIQPGRPDRKVKAIAAGFIVVILCAMGVSVAALNGSSSDPSEAAGSAQKHEDASEEPAGLAAEGDAPDAGSDADADEASGPVEQSSKKPESNGSGSTSGPKTPTTKTPTTKAPGTSPTTAKPPTTTPPTTAPTTTSTTAAPKPEVLTVSAPSTFACSEAPEFQSPNTLTVSWTTKNATSVSIAIDSPTGIFESGLPANGSMELSAPCQGDTQTYYVIAHGTGGATATKSVTTNGI